MMPTGRHEIFIGIATTPGHALADTAAQEGCMGTTALEQCENLLAEHNLKVQCIKRASESSTPSCSGIGGEAEYVGSVLMPTGLAGLNGLTTWHI